MLARTNHHINNQIVTGPQGRIPAMPGWRGHRVGLLGGSFDPPHVGHRHIAMQALRRLRLHCVWLMVSPGNPLKSRPRHTFSSRLTATAQLVANHPRINATDVEMRLGTTRTVDTLRQLRRFCPTVQFVWLMGSDNFVTIHHWARWSSIFELVPIAVFGRPDSVVAAGLSVAAFRFAQRRVSQRDAAALVRMQTPSWCLLTGPTSISSSTSLRGWRAT